MDGKRLKLVPFCANNPWRKNMTHKDAMLPFPTGVWNSTTFALRRCKKPLVVKETQLLFNSILAPSTKHWLFQWVVCYRKISQCFCLAF